jgi:hypothetical protein
MLPTEFPGYIHVLQQAKAIRPPNWSQALTTLALGMVIYLSSLVIYRIYLSLVAASPGHFLARTTYWYHTYVRTSMYYQKVAESHARHDKPDPRQTIVDGTDAAH